MGWSIRIKTDKPVTDDIVRDCIAEMPESMQKFGEQEWGWSCSVDVQKPSRCSKSLGWYISGAYWSWDEGAPFAALLKALLEKRGYKVTLGEQS